jgi:hypothetical protein
MRVRLVGNCEAVQMNNEPIDTMHVLKRETPLFCATTSNARKRIATYYCPSCGSVRCPVKPRSTTLLQVELLRAAKSHSSFQTDNLPMIAGVSIGEDGVGSLNTESAT